MIEFLAGGVAVAQAIAGVFFLKFWRRTRERLFVSFAIAFWLMAISQMVGTLYGATEDRQAAAYLPRVVGFLIILFAIVRMNVQRRRD